MRVVVPFVGSVHPLTRARVEDWPGGCEFVDLSDDAGYGYSKLLRRIWADQETAMIVEHDVVPHSWTLPEFAVCPEPYCASAYALEAYTGVALGCTKFSDLLMRCYPDAAEIASRIVSPITGEPGYYIGFDVWLQGAVLAEHYGWQPHHHPPPVAHENPARRLCDAAVGQPIRTTVAWGQRIYLAPGTVERIAAEVAEEHHPSGKAGYVG